MTQEAMRYKSGAYEEWYRFYRVCSQGQEVREIIRKQVRRVNKSAYRLQSPSRCGSSLGQSLWWSRGQPVWGLRMYQGRRRSLSLEMELQEETQPQSDSLHTSEGKISPKSCRNILLLPFLSPLSIFTGIAVARDQGRSHPRGWEETRKSLMWKSK